MNKIISLLTLAIIIGVAGQASAATKKEAAAAPTASAEIAKNASEEATAPATEAHAEEASAETEAK